MKNAIIIGVLVIGGYTLIVYTFPRFLKEFGDKMETAITQPVEDLWKAFFPTSEQIQNEGLWPDAWPSTDDYFGEEGLWPDAWWP